MLAKIKYVAIFVLNADAIVECENCFKLFRSGTTKFNKYKNNVLSY